MKLCPECFSEYQDDLLECPEDKVKLASVEPDPLIGTKVAERYVVESVLGRGGMGVVYRARHEIMDRTVAIKMLHAHLISDAEALKRFHREAKAVSRVQHRNTITLYDFGITSAGQPFIVMDYIEGVSLKQVIKQDGGLSLSRIDHIFQQVIDALDCAHHEGVIHRDLKPENIMLTLRSNDPDWVEVVDFGISKLLVPAGADSGKISRITRIGDVCGSPPYMSPEQCISSMQIDARSDIYSLGVVLYEALTNKLPFRCKSAVEMIDSHLYGQPTPLKVTKPELAVCDSLNNMLTKALQKEPDKRQQSMAEFGSELREAIRLDSLKLMAAKQRAEVAELKNLIGEAEQSSSKTGNKALPTSKTGDGRSTGGRQPAVTNSTAAKKTTTVYHKPRSPGLKGVAEEVADFWANLFEIDQDKGYEKRSYVLTECPYCLTAVEPTVNFCLNCGRPLAAPQDVARLRKDQQKFSYPKMQKLGGTDTPQFSQRARVVTMGGGFIWGMPKELLYFIVILSACLFYISGSGKALTSTIGGLPKWFQQQQQPHDHRVHRGK